MWNEQEMKSEMRDETMETKNINECKMNVKYVWNDGWNEGWNHVWYDEKKKKCKININLKYMLNEWWNKLWYDPWHDDKKKLYGINLK